MNSTRYNKLKNKPIGHQRLFRRGFPGMSRERASRNASTFQKETNRQPIASRPPVSDPKIYMDVNQIIGIKNSCHALAMTRPGAPISANPASPCIRGNLFIHLPPLLNAPASGHCRTVQCQIPVSQNIQKRSRQDAVLNLFVWATGKGFRAVCRIFQGRQTRFWRKG